MKFFYLEDFSPNVKESLLPSLTWQLQEAKSEPISPDGKVAFRVWICYVTRATRFPNPVQAALQLLSRDRKILPQRNNHGCGEFAPVSSFRWGRENFPQPRNGGTIASARYWSHLPPATSVLAASDAFRLQNYSCESLGAELSSVVLFWWYGNINYVLVYLRCWSGFSNWFAGYQSAASDQVDERESGAARSSIREYTTPAIDFSGGLSPLLIMLSLWSRVTQLLFWFRAKRVFLQTWTATWFYVVLCDFSLYRFSLFTWAVVKKNKCVILFTFCVSMAHG